MDPQPNLPTPSPEFPTPHSAPPEAGSAENPIAPPEQLKQQPEVAGVRAELPPAVPAMPAPMPASPLPTAPPPAFDPAAQTQTIPVSDAPAVAEDNDLIEKEWVYKAKAIVERTKNDPHEQNKEINKFKADYIKKRYKREIKVNEA